MKEHKNSLPALLVCTIVMGSVYMLIPAGEHAGTARADGVVPFTQTILDSAAAESKPLYGLHTKAVGDLNADGYPDPIVAGATVGQALAWYASPGGTKQVISELGGWSTDAAVGDIDQDGDQDVVISAWYRDDQGIEWFENPGGEGSWTHHPIGPPQAHDIELVDLDLDGDLDIITRLQEGDGDAVQVWRQDSPQEWQRTEITEGVPTGEGLAAGDIDGDAYPDIVVNGLWFANPRDILGGTWTGYPYTTAWTDPDTRIAVGDINRDGRPDIALTPSEIAGEFYHVSWFESPADPKSTTEWVEHIVDPNVETVLHSLQLADIDKDGDLDLVTAKMLQGAAPADVSLYINVGTAGRGTEWSRQVIATTGSHSLKAADFDLDGDVDLFGANWSDDDTVYLYRNDLNQRLPLDNWTRRVIDESRPWNAVFISGGDVDGDGLADVITGGWWYRNPGTPDGAWTRNAIGDPLNNMAAVYDYDSDGDLDILGTPWAGSGADPSFVWANNDGAGQFEILDNVPAGEGDFLQGVAVGRFTIDGPIETALSWHDGTGNGVQMLTTSAAPASEAWSWRRLSDADQSEQLSAGDIDRDGDLDLLLGTEWLRNSAGTYSASVLFSTTEQPDRNRLGDINRDGRLDAVVGFLGISTPAKLAWYEQGADPLEPWAEHVIATVVGPMSLDVADLDLDGDLDVVIGEHNLDQPDTARVIVFENGDGAGGTWASHVVYTGDEHHDGTQLVDIDNDGDLDIVSIGWGHSRVLLYQNNAMESGVKIQGPVEPSTPPMPPTPEPPTEPDGTDTPPADDGEQVAGETPDVPACGACGTGTAPGAALSLLLMGALRYHRGRRFRHRL